MQIYDNLVNFQQNDGLVSYKNYVLYVIFEYSGYYHNDLGYLSNKNLHTYYNNIMLTSKTDPKGAQRLIDSVFAY